MTPNVPAAFLSTNKIFHNRHNEKKNFTKYTEIIMQQCNLDPTQWPDRNERVLRLKHIGQLMDQQLQTAGIRTMQDFVNRVQGQTRAQNTADWKVFFANANPSACLPPPKQYQYPWSTSRRDIPPAQRANLPSGQYEYCVRSYNRCAWASAANYMLGQPDVDNRRVPYVDISRDNWCQNSNPRYCKPDVSSSSSSSRRPPLPSRKKSPKKKSPKKAPKKKSPKKTRTKKAPKKKK